jgi:predicted ATPase
LKEKKKELNNHYFYNKKEDTFVEKLNITLEKAFDEWFQLMGIEGFDGTEIKRIINLFLNANKFDNTPIDISQVGFGVSQMFPIVLEGLRMEKGCTLLLEQPEIHLHPNLQMQIADYLISLALSDKRIIVETHSDHIINRLVRRIIEDDMLHLNDLIGIYFIKQSENGSIFEEINIDDTKGITNWPPDFFDQAANEQMRIMQAGLKKRKNQRNKSKE